MSYPPSTFYLDPQNMAVVESKQSFDLSALYLIRTLGLLIVGVVAIILFFPMIDETLLVLRLKREGASTETSRFYTGLDQDGSKQLFYTFSVDGKTYSAHHGIAPLCEKDLNAANVIRINYLPDDPGVSHLAGDNALNYPGMAAALAVILGSLLWGGYRLLNWIRHRRDQHSSPSRLLRARVTAYALHADAQGNTLLTVSYRFRTIPLFGKKLDGQTSQIRNDLKNVPLPAPQNTSAWILYRSGRDYKLL